MAEHTQTTIARAFDRLMAAIDHLPGHWPMTGGAVTIVSREHGVETRCFGTTSPSGGVPVHDGHLFEIGSISKSFTGLAILSLVDDGLCDLDAPVTHYLPWFRVESDFAPITIRHLLHHTSGLIKGADDPPDGLAQCLGLAKTRTGSVPGSYFNYSNVGYMLLGEVIQSLSGMTVAQFCQTRLLQPMGMSGTIACIANVDRARMAVGTAPLRDDLPFIPGDLLAPATWFEVDVADGNVASNALDMGTFLQMLLGRGKIGDRSIVSERAFETLISDLAVSGEGWTDGFGEVPVETSHYGLGINVETVDGRFCITHGGGMVGYSSFVLADLDAGIGISVLTNANGNFPVGQVLARLGHAMLNRSEVDLSGLDFTMTSGSAGYDPDMLGPFLAIDPDGKEIAVTVALHKDRLVMESGDNTAQLYRNWPGGYLAALPDLRRFQISFAKDRGDPRWLCGPLVLRRAGAAFGPPAIDPSHAALVGRYRSFCAWYPTFRIVAREGRLYLVAPGGVEAPGTDTELVPVADGLYRIGSDAWLPERLQAGPVINGRVASVSRDGCLYSRTQMD